MHISGAIMSSVDISYIGQNGGVQASSDQGYGQSSEAENLAVAHPPRVEFCGLPITVGLTVASVIERTFGMDFGDVPILTTFINPAAFHLAKDSCSYVEALGQFDIVLPDGIGVVWGLRIMMGVHTERVSFDSTSLALPVLRRAQRDGKSVMLIGGAPSVAERAGKRLAVAVPGLRIIGIMDGFRSFREYENAVRLAKPDVTICGMGAPRQEELLVRLRQARAWRGLGFTCGGYFDQLQDGLTYYPPLVDQWEIRWLYRLTREPRRLFRRYAIEYQDYWRALAHHALHRPMQAE